MDSRRRDFITASVLTLAVLLIGLLVACSEGPAVLGQDRPESSSPSFPPPAPGFAPASQPIIQAPPQPLQPDLPIPLTTGFQPTTPQPFGSPVGRFHFSITDKTPLAELLPKTPKNARTGSLYTEDPLRVTEVTFEDYQTKAGNSDVAMEKIAQQIAKINHLNRKKHDNFMATLLDKRSDLTGLPVTMGDKCRMSDTRGQQFNQALANLRNFMNTQISVSLQQAEKAPTIAADSFWQQYCSNCLQNDAVLSSNQPQLCDDACAARIAALMQVLMVESTPMQKGLVKYLATISNVEATRSLARLAVFAADSDVRDAAIEALKVRREKHYSEILVNALRYPWPDIARRASDALIKLDRADLVPQLVDILGEGDPRDPVVKKVDGKEVTVVRELVRINHHRNCMLCHAPHDPQAPASPGAVVAQVPIPGTPLPTPEQGYQSSIPDILVRADITYIRQDFSLRQPVADAHPWPQMQRFDFLVRTRTLNTEETKAYDEVIAQREKNYLSPNQQATLAALRRLTGRDIEPTREAWRKALSL